MAIFQNKSTGALLGYLLTVGLSGLLCIVGIQGFFGHEIQLLEHRVANERAKVDLGGQIIDALLGIEADYYQMIITRHSGLQEGLRVGILRQVESINQILSVLEKGGTVGIRKTNMDAEVGPSNLSITYFPESEQVYYPEIMALQSKLAMLDGEMAVIVKVLSQRNEFQRANDPLGMGRALTEILPLVKKATPFFTRTKLNSSRIYSNSMTSMLELEQSIQTRKHLNYVIEGILVLAILIICIWLGTLISKRIHANALSLDQAKQAAEVANRAKSTFLENISHEFRTPLNSILGYAQILSDDASLGEKQQDAIGAIHQSGDHLLALLNNILEVSIIESQSLELNRKEFSLSPFLDLLADLVAVKANKKGITFDYELSPDLPAVIYGDEIRLSRVLRNLFDNALAFTNKGGIVFRIEKRITSKECLGNTATIRFSIEGSGSGIKSERKEDNFQSSQSVDGMLPNGVGSDFGLLISHRLVQAMGSELNVDSPVQTQANGAWGSVFWFDVEFEVTQISDVNASSKGYCHVNNSRRNEDVASGMVVPALDELYILLGISMTGDISQLNRKIESISNQDLRYEKFLNNIRFMAKKFAFDEIESYLKLHMDKMK